MLKSALDEERLEELRTTVGGIVQPGEADYDEAGSTTRCTTGADRPGRRRGEGSEPKRDVSTPAWLLEREAGRNRTNSPRHL
jgi:hypothetical protein